MEGYALYLLGAVLIVYGFFITRTKKIFIPQNYETAVILTLLLISQAASESFLGFGLLISIFGVVVLALSTKNYILYHAEYAQVKKMVKKILDKKKISYTENREQLILGDHDGVIRLRPNGRVVTVILAKSKGYYQELKDEIKAGYLTLDHTYSKSGSVFIGLGVVVLLLGVILR